MSEWEYLQLHYIQKSKVCPTLTSTHSDKGRQFHETGYIFTAICPNRKNPKTIALKSYCRNSTLSSKGSEDTNHIT